MQPAITTAGQTARVLTERRRELILDELRRAGSVSSDRLAERFQVAGMTIYRDLKALDERGLLRMVRGGAVQAAGPEAEPHFAQKRSANAERKERIARHAATQFVTEGDIIILEAGTTTAAMVRHLRSRSITLVTNGLETLNEASSLLPTANVLCCGGLLRDPAHTFVGPQAERFFHGIRARTLFLGASGLSLEDGVTDASPLEVQVKQAMAASAERVVLLLDSSKFGRRSLIPLQPLETIHAIVTDADAPAGMVAELRARGSDVIIAPD